MLGRLLVSNWDGRQARCSRAGTGPKIFDGEAGWGGWAVDGEAQIFFRFP